MISLCGCSGITCTLFKDNFNRADETFGATDSTGNWSDSGLPKFQIVSNELVCITAGTSANDFAPMLTVRGLPHDQHWALSEWIKFKLPANGKFRLGLSISPPNEDSIDFLSAFIEITAGSSDYYAPTCGAMQFMAPDPDTGEPVHVGESIPVEGLFAGTWFKARFCLDWCLNLAIATIMEADGTDGQSHHVTVPHVVSDAGSNGPLFNIGATLWCDRQITGTYTFDDYKLEALRIDRGYGGYCYSYGYDYGYGYGYSGDTFCPACHPKNPFCEDAQINFPSTDCRWLGDGSDGGCWQGSWSGIDAYGFPDNTTGAKLIFTVPEGGGSVTLSIGPNAAAVVVNADGTGTFTVGAQTQTFEDFTFDAAVFILACCDGDTFIGTFLGEPLWYEQAAECGGEACVTNGGVDLVSLRVFHNLHHPDCGECLKPVIEESPCTGTPQDCETAVDCDERPIECGPVPACANNEFPKHAVFSATPMQASNCRNCLEWLSGVFIGDLDETFTFTSGCTRICPFPVGLFGTTACDAFYDTGFSHTFETEDIGCPCVDPLVGRIGWRFIAQIYLDDDCNYRMFGSISEFRSTMSGVDTCCVYKFRSGVIGDVMNPPVCPGLSVALDYESCFCGSDPEFLCDADAPAQNNCDFRGSSLMVSLQ